MPSEHTDADALHLSPLLVAQIKYCATCLSPLAQLPPAHDPIDPSAPLVCAPCRERTTRAAKQLADAELLSGVDVAVRIDDGGAADFSMFSASCPIPTAPPPANPSHPLVFRTASPTPTLTSDNDTNTSSITFVTPPSTPHSLAHVCSLPSVTSSSRSPSPPLPQDARTTIPSLISLSDPSSSSSSSTSQSPSLPQSQPQRPQLPKDPDPDPLCDITRLRVRSHSEDCLYPGSQFCGTQKSGRSSYEVSVNIVDVDFTSSFLCGYLRIRGLTDDWPELTTYFDAQIIGQRYGFLTDGWGASEAQDMTHWDRFPAFHRVKPDIRGPKLLLKDPSLGESRSCVFMRWKERFLVPDHRVRDINGASFAGFYYVCVEFNPCTPSQPAMPLPQQQQQQLSQPPPPSSTSLDGSICALPEEPEPLLVDCNCECDTATMSGFYFHQNSEPYQQLSLRHVPSESMGVFEFR